MKFQTIHNHIPRTEYVPFEKTVIEKKAPTDDSIRLLNEFQEKAKADIVAKIDVDDNILKGCAVYFYLDVTGEYKYYLKFSLNGKEYNIQGKEPYFEFKRELNEYSGLGNKNIFDMFYKKFSEAITAELMRQCQSELIDISQQLNNYK